MNENAPEGTNIQKQYTLPVQLLEKFKYSNRDNETEEAIKALENNNPTELQIEIVLGEIKNLTNHLKDVTQPWREISNESELISDRERLEEAEKILYENLAKINHQRI